MTNFPFWKTALAAMWINKRKQQMGDRKTSPESPGEV